jgi:3-isopropylmalate/(R)-2-methylmalate dehydratase small subunit
MTPFTTLSAVAAPIMRANVDTDIIIPIDRMVGNSIRGNLGKWCFRALRYVPDGSENPEFILNRPPYRDAEVLITGPNFGCGSSREAAVWALQEMGIRAIVGSSFGDIFQSNCFQNGVLPIVLDEAVVESLADEVQASQGAGRVTIDLEEGVVTSPSGVRHTFAIEPRRRTALIEGLDEIGLTLRRDAEIAAFQARDRERRPWIHLTGEPV